MSFDEDSSFTYGIVKSIKSTNKALLVRDEDGEEFWVPKSQIHVDSSVFQVDQEGSLVVNEWYANKQGWC